LEATASWSECRDPFLLARVAMNAFVSSTVGMSSQFGPTVRI
jgi:hypothetical protein